MFWKTRNPMRTLKNISLHITTTHCGFQCFTNNPPPTLNSVGACLIQINIFRCPSLITDIHLKTIGVGVLKISCRQKAAKTRRNKAIRDVKYLARHMPVLGNVHRFKIENCDIFLWRHFSARSSCYIITLIWQPKRFPWKTYLKEIVCPVFEIRHWIVTC